MRRQFWNTKCCFPKRQEETEFKIFVSDVYTYLGDMYAKAGQKDAKPESAELETARTYYGKVLKLIESELKRYPDDETYQEMLVRTLGKLGDSYVSQKRYEDAIPIYKQIIEIGEKTLMNNFFNWMEIGDLSKQYISWDLFMEKSGKRNLKENNIQKL